MKHNGNIYGPSAAGVKRSLRCAQALCFTFLFCILWMLDVWLGFQALGVLNSNLAGRKHRHTCLRDRLSWLESSKQRIYSNSVGPKKVYTFFSSI